MYDASDMLWWIFEFDNLKLSDLAIKNVLESKTSDKRKYLISTAFPRPWDKRKKNYLDLWKKILMQDKDPKVSQKAKSCLRIYEAKKKGLYK